MKATSHGRSSHRCAPGNANNLSLCTLGYPQIVLSALGCLPAFCYGVGQHSQGSIQRTYKTPAFESCWFQKLMKTGPCHFQRQWLQGSALLVHFPVWTSLPLSSPLPNFTANKALSPLQHLWSVSPPNPISTFPTFLDMVSSLPLDVQVVLSVYMFNLFGYSVWFDSYLVLY